MRGTSGSNYIRYYHTHLLHHLTEQVSCEVNKVAICSNESAVIIFNCICLPTSLILKRAKTCYITRVKLWVYYLHYLWWNKSDVKLFGDLFVLMYCIVFCIVWHIQSTFCVLQSWSFVETDIQWPKCTYILYFSIPFNLSDLECWNTTQNIFSPNMA